MNRLPPSLFLYMVFFIHSSLQQSGNNCDCTRREECKPWVDAIRKGIYLNLPICGFDQYPHTPLLCCPRSNLGKRSVSEEGVADMKQSHFTSTDNSFVSSVRKAEQKCDEFAKAVFMEEPSPLPNEPNKLVKKDNCGRNSGLIITDPSKALPGEFPHMAQIGFGKEMLWLCAGSLISEKTILTTAVCSQGTRDNTPAQWAKLGDLDTSTESDEADPQIYKVIKIIVHPDFRPPSFYNDVALLKLEKDVVFGPYIRPACLYTTGEMPQNELVATGWGHETWGGQPSWSLKKIGLKYVSHDNCSEIYRKEVGKPKLPRGIQNDSMICTLETTTDKYVCQGDSGGPVQIPLNKPYCTYGLIGLISFGKLCGHNNPTVSTRIIHYITWIVENTWSE